MVRGGAFGCSQKWQHDRCKAAGTQQKHILQNTTAQFCGEKKNTRSFKADALFTKRQNVL